MNNPFHWTISNPKTLEHKTHFKRSCKVCLEFGGKVGCLLPFRKKEIKTMSSIFIKRIN